MYFVVKKVRVLWKKVKKIIWKSLADAIPGLKGYREKESRRDTDKRFRDYLADKIDRSRGTLDELKRTLSIKANLMDLQNSIGFPKK